MEERQRWRNSISSRHVRDEFDLELARTFLRVQARLVLTEQSQPGKRQRLHGVRVNCPRWRGHAHPYVTEFPAPTSASGSLESSRAVRAHESRGRFGASRPRACTERVLRPGRRTPNSDRVADQSPRAMPPARPSENAALQGTETIVVVVRGAPKQAGQLDYPRDVLRASTKALPDLRDIHAGFDETHDPALDGAESGALNDRRPLSRNPGATCHERPRASRNRAHRELARTQPSPVRPTPGDATRTATWRSGASHQDWIRVRRRQLRDFRLSSSAPPSSRSLTARSP